MSKLAALAGLLTLTVGLGLRPRHRDALASVAHLPFAFVLGMLAALAAVAGTGDPVLALRRILATLPLQPLLSLYLGLLLGTLLREAGAGEVLRGSFAGLSARFGSPAAPVAIVSLFPLALALPCGHTFALAVLVPLLGPAGRLGLSPVQGAVLAAAFLRTAYGSCAAAAAGGIVRVGEAALSSPGATATPDLLRAPQLFALILAAGATAVYARMLLETGPRPPGTLPESGGSIPPPAALPTPAPDRALVALLSIVLLGTLAVAAHAQVRRLEPLTWLALGTAVMAVIAGSLGRIAPSRLLAETPAGPVVDMTLGLLLAGAAQAAGAFQLVGDALAAAASWPFPGPAGVLVALAFLPLLLPLSCGRVLAVALIPLVASLGPQGSGTLSAIAVAVAVATFTLFAGMSCVVSPTGGCLAWGDSSTDRHGASQRAALNLAAVAVVAPVVGAYLRWMAPPEPRITRVLLFALVAIAAGYLVVNRIRAIESVARWGSLRRLGWLVVLGGVAGTLTAFGSHDPTDRVILAPGETAGIWLGGTGAGALAAAGIGLMHGHGKAA